MPLPANDQSTAGLVERKLIASYDIDAAVASYLKKPSPGPVALGESYTIDIGAAVEAHKPARVAMASDAASEGSQRTMVRTAIILGTPEKA